MSMSDQDELAALRQQVAAYKADAAKRGKLGRRPNPPTSPDAKLIARVCQALGFSRRQLAERLGVHHAILSRTNGPEGIPLAEWHRAALRKMLENASLASLEGASHEPPSAHVNKDVDKWKTGT